jgi:hypothetical protein
MFTPNIDDLQFLFESAGQRVLINDVPQQAIITLPPLSENEERYIHTLKRLNMGDMVTLDNNEYLVMTEVITPRNGKYKAKIKHCNYTIEFQGEEIGKELLYDEDGNQVLDPLGRPVYKIIYSDPVSIPAIVEHNKFSIDGGRISFATDEIVVTVQANETNIDKLATNVEFELMGLRWKVRQQDFTKKGLLSVVCMLQPSE